MTGVAGVGRAVGRRRFLAGLAAIGLSGLAPRGGAAEVAPPLALLKDGYRRRILAIRDKGMLPILDIESSYNPYEMNVDTFVQAMDRNGIAVMAASVDMPGKHYSETNRWSEHSLELASLHPDHFIPTGNGGVHPAWTRHPDRFLDDTEAAVRERGYPLMGEFEFRHYPSPRQVDRGETFRDVTIPIDGPQGQRLFALSEQTGVAFQLHYEIEDDLLPPLVAMLERYPKAKVIWCHFAQIRYGWRARAYGPAFLRGLLERFANLYVDTAFGGPEGVYKPSGEHHAHYWADPKAWQAVINDHPHRFLAALDLGGDRMDRMDEWSDNLRRFLGSLAPDVADIVAYRSAWRLLFGEDFP